MRSVLFSAFLIGLFSSGVANAYLPPSFYFYEKISSTVEKTVPTGILLSVSKPLPGGNEETIGTFAVAPIAPATGGWPSLSILFLNDPEAIISSVEKFGIPVAREKDLMRATREQAAAMKEAPRPFYSRDKRMFLKRFRNIYAWVHAEGPEMAKSIWVEKDTWTPIKISAPCPEKIDSLPWLKAGANKCDLEFRNVSSLRRGNIQSAKITLYRDGTPALIYSFEKVFSKNQNPGETNLSEDVREISSLIFH